MSSNLTASAKNWFQAVSGSLKARIPPYENAGFLFMGVLGSPLMSQFFWGTLGGIIGASKMRDAPVAAPLSFEVIADWPSRDNLPIRNSFALEIFGGILS